MDLWDGAKPWMVLLSSRIRDAWRNRRSLDAIMVLSIED